MALLLYAPSGIATSSLCRVFEHSGLSFDQVHTEEAFYAKARSLHYATVVVINVGKVENLLEVYEKWKKLRRQSAFVAISSRESGVERARALQAGITSYHIAPFSYTQLVTDIAQHEYIHGYDARIIEAHDLAVDIVSRAATYKGTYLRLTKRQFDLLYMLVCHPGQVFSRVQIWENLWNDGDYPLANTVDVHVNRLRRALPKEASCLVETVYGFGYRLKPR